MNCFVKTNSAFDPIFAHFLIRRESHSGTPDISLPGWLKTLGYSLSVSLLFSGFAYGLLLHQAEWSAYVSGVFPLIWVGSFCVFLGSGRTNPAVTQGTT